MGLQWLQETGGGVNSWECAFCRRRSRAHRRIVLTITHAPSDRQSMKCCDLECLRRLLALWEELETKKANNA
jgi:hypothetical protein